MLSARCWVLGAVLSARSGAKCLVPCRVQVVCEGGACPPKRTDGSGAKAGEPSTRSRRLTDSNRLVRSGGQTVTRRSAMFGFRYDKVEWLVGVLLLAAMAVAAFA